jgi:2'-5' RNA ligase
MAESDKKVRTFIAVKMADELIEQIVKLQDDLKTVTEEKVKWVEPHNIHITLKFLGEIPSTKLESVFQATTKACLNFPAFELSLKDLGIFPNYRRPRVAWIGISEGKEELAEVAGRIDEELSHIGFPKEERKFKSHITLARLKRKPYKLLKEMKTKSFSSELSTVDSVKVIKSKLTRKGPIYTVLKSIELKEL